MVLCVIVVMLWKNIVKVDLYFILVCNFIFKVVRLICNIAIPLYIFISTFRLSLLFLNALISVYLTYLLTLQQLFSSFTISKSPTSLTNYFSDSNTNFSTSTGCTYLHNFWLSISILIIIGYEDEMLAIVIVGFGSLFEGVVCWSFSALFVGGMRFAVSTSRAFCRNVCRLV